MKWGIPKMRFELEPYHRNVTDNELIEDLKRVAQQLGKNTLTNIEEGYIHHSNTPYRLG